MSDFLTLLPLACVLCVVLSACRFQLNLGFADRPLVAGVVWGALVGPMEASVGVALFFELLWMDLIPAGTYVPPQMTAAALSALCMVSGLGLYEVGLGAGQVAVALFLALPLAMLGRMVEQGERNRLNAAHDALWESVSDPTRTFAPGGVILATLGRTALLNAGIFLACTSLAGMVCALLAQPLGGGAAMGGLEWWQLWFGASLGGLLSLRYRAAYGVTLAGVLGVAVLAAFWGL